MSAGDAACSMQTYVLSLNHWMFTRMKAADLLARWRWVDVMPSGQLRFGPCQVEL